MKVDILGFIIEMRNTYSGYRYRIQDNTATITCFHNLTDQCQPQGFYSLGDLVNIRGVVKKSYTSSYNIRLDYIRKINNVEAECIRAFEMENLYHHYDIPFRITKKQFKLREKNKYISKVHATKCNDIVDLPIPVFIDESYYSSSILHDSNNWSTLSLNSNVDLQEKYVEDIFYSNINTNSTPLLEKNVKNLNIPNITPFTKNYTDHGRIKTLENSQDSLHKVSTILFNDPDQHLHMTDNHSNNTINSQTLIMDNAKIITTSSKNSSYLIERLQFSFVKRLVKSLLNKCVINWLKYGKRTDQSLFISDINFYRQVLRLDLNCPERCNDNFYLKKRVYNDFTNIVKKKLRYIHNNCCLSNQRNFSTFNLENGGKVTPDIKTFTFKSDSSKLFHDFKFLADDNLVSEDKNKDEVLDESLIDVHFTYEKNCFDQINEIIMRITENKNDSNTIVNEQISDSMNYDIHIIQMIDEILSKLSNLGILIRSRKSYPFLQLDNGGNTHKYLITAKLSSVKY
ncbi:unnamed protein product [Gordionus sp. m RMFG-2023]